MDVEKAFTSVVIMGLLRWREETKKACSLSSFESMDAQPHIPGVSPVVIHNNSIEGGGKDHQPEE
jgi:hypothetical protein